MLLIYKRTLKTHHHIFALILRAVYVTEKLLAGLKYATQDWYESVVNLTALTRDAADDVTWVHKHPAPFCLVS